MAMSKGIEGIVEPWENSYSLIKLISYFYFFYISSFNTFGITYKQDSRFVLRQYTYLHLLLFA